jgi:hypothetical protein
MIRCAAIRDSRSCCGASALAKHLAHIVRDWLCLAHEARDPCRYIVTLRNGIAMAVLPPPASANYPSHWRYAS